MLHESKRPLLGSCIVLALYTSAYCTEIVRGAIDAVPTVTRRAARSLGMTWGQDMTYVVFPMALRVAIDVGFDGIMSEGERKSLATQCGLCHGIACEAENRPHVRSQQSQHVPSHHAPSRAPSMRYHHCLTPLGCLTS